MKSKGFTLIELLVVVAIIGILATVVLASLGSARTKASEARKLSDLGQLRNAFELYNLDNGDYPTPSGGTFSYCIGKSSAETCWGGDVSGNDDLNTALEDYISLDYFGGLSGDDASAFVVHKGRTTSDGGCVAATDTGYQILWLPKDDGSEPNNASQCPGESVYTGCGSGIYNKGPYSNKHCALRLESTPL